MARPLAEEARRSLKPGGYLLLELAPENVHLPHQVLEGVALEAPLEERLGPVKGLLGQGGGEAAI